jgi:hypothetical protein
MKREKGPSAALGMTAEMRSEKLKARQSPRRLPPTVSNVETVGHPQRQMRRKRAGKMPALRKAERKRRGTRRAVQKKEGANRTARALCIQLPSVVVSTRCRSGHSSRLNRSMTHSLLSPLPQSRARLLPSTQLHVSPCRDGRRITSVLFGALTVSAQLRAELAHNSTNSC